MKLPIANCRLPIAGGARVVPTRSTPARQMGGEFINPFRIASAADSDNPRSISIANRQSPIGKAAFTLIEIMVAVMVFSLVIGAIYATWALVMRATVVGQDAAAQAQRQRVVLRSIGDAIMGIESFQASQQYYWFKLANGSVPYLSFVARLPDSYARNGKFVGAAGGRDASERRVTFTLASGDNGERDLVLQQSPILMDMDDDEQKFPLVLAKNVKEFTVEWWGTNRMNEAEWSKDWDDSQTNSIPAMLRVRLVLGNDSSSGRYAKASSETAFAATRIYTVPSQMMPAAVQRGTVGSVLNNPNQNANQGKDTGQKMNNLINGLRR
jgi:prepilin-type N-terminal cleavage/methylation domain-containing protein